MCRPILALLTEPISKDIRRQQWRCPANCIGLRMFSLCRYWYIRPKLQLVFHKECFPCEVREIKISNKKWQKNKLPALVSAIEHQYRHSGSQLLHQWKKCVTMIVHYFKHLYCKTLGMPSSFIHVAAFVWRVAEAWRLMVSSALRPQVPAGGGLHGHHPGCEVSEGEGAARSDRRTRG